MGRRKQPKGERRHGAGWEVYVRVNGELRRKFFPLDSAPAERRAWRILQQHTAPKRVHDGTLAGDIADYLSTVKHMPTYAERKFHLDQWIKVFGPDTPRGSITTTQINAALSHWRSDGKSATTVRHYRTALLHLFHRLDGKDAANPVRASWRPPDPPLQPRAIPPSTLRAILKAIKGPKTRARLRVMAATGLPHKQLMHLQPSDIDWAHSRVKIQARSKGHGAPARWLPLNKHARFALRAMAKTDAWGEFSSGAMRTMWQRALERLGLPLTIRPYDVRHTAGTLLYQATGDLATVARLLGHADPRTASRYSMEAHADVDAQAMAKAGKQLAAKLARSRNANKNREQ